MTQLVMTGQVVDQPEDRPPADGLVQEERRAQAQEELPGDGHHGVADGRPERPPEEGVAERPRVVVEAQEGRLARAASSR